MSRSGLLYPPTVPSASSRSPRWGGLLLVVLGACTDAPTRVDAAASNRDDEARAQAREQLLEGDPDTLLHVLGRPHAATRDELGAHVMTIHSELSLTPATAPEANPAAGSTPAVAQSIVDDLALTWQPADDQGPRLALEQHNDHGRGRSVVVVGGQLYAKLAHRAWTRHPVESEIHDVWLDDAQFTARDALEFLLPGASVAAATAPGEGWSGGDGIRITLSKDAGGGTPPTKGVQAWRAGVAFSALSATVVIDADTGAWVRVDAQATYTVSGGAGGPLNGQFEVHALVAAAAESAPRVEAPAQAVALPERHRYEVERKRLLDGLAAP